MIIVTGSRKWEASLLGAILAFGPALVGCGPTVNVSNLSPERTLQDQVERRRLAMTAVLRKIVGYDALDEDSLKFRNETLYHQGGPETKDEKLAYPPGWILCGEVNGKNGLGGYTGYRSFVAVLSVKFNDDGSIAPVSIPVHQESDEMSENPLKQFCHTDERVR